MAPLQLVAESVAGPISERAWESLSDCLKKCGRKNTTEKPAVARNEIPDVAIPTKPGRVNVQIPGFGTLKFSAKDGAISITVEPQKPQA